MRGVAGSGRTALIVDDHPWTRLLLADALGEHGFAVSEASNGHTGLRLAQREEWDLIVLDLSLPELSGREVLHQLRSEPADARRRVLVVSGNLEQLPTHERHLADGMLEKPFDMDEVMQHVDRLVH
jgi:DNA-binding response OmpR family regulator